MELMISPYSHSVAKTSTNYAEAAARGLLALNSRYESDSSQTF